MDFRGMFCKEVLHDRVSLKIETEGFDGAYSLNNNQAVIMTNGQDYEILVERNLYELLNAKGIVPKTNWF